MKKPMIFATCMLSALVWAGAQQPNSGPGQSGAPGAQSGAQSTAPGATTPGASQSPSGMPGTAGPSDSQASPQAAGAGQASAPITEGCLGGSSPNFTLTDAAGKTYKLALPASADGSKLTPHVGESVQVLGQVSGSDSINVSQIGKGSGKCPAK